MVAEGAVISGTVLFIIAKAFGLIGTLILFEVCHEKLEELAWYRWVAGQFTKARAWARHQVEPALVQFRHFRSQIESELTSRFGRGGSASPYAPPTRAADAEGGKSALTPFS